MLSFCETFQKGLASATWRRTLSRDVKLNCAAESSAIPASPRETWRVPEQDLREEGGGLRWAQEPVDARACWLSLWPSGVEGGATLEGQILRVGSDG